MKTYEYTVTLRIQVDAFDDSDAWDAVQEAFGIGENLGVTVVDCEYELSK